MYNLRRFISDIRASTTPNLTKIDRLSLNKRNTYHIFAGPVVNFRNIKFRNRYYNAMISYNGDIIYTTIMFWNGSSSYHARTQKNEKMIDHMVFQ